MALQTPDNDSDLNPAQEDYRRKFDGINKAEEAGGANSNLDDIKNAEETPEDGWANNYTGSKQASDTKVGGRFDFMKKKSATATIITLILGGGSAIMLLSPSMLIVNMKEVMAADIHNWQLPSLTRRTDAVLNSKINRTTTDICTSVVSIACKFSSVSDSQISKFEEAGIKVNVDEDAFTILGRKKPVSFEFNGKTIEASNFIEETASSTEFRSAVKEAYNPKWVGFADSIWSFAKTKLGISEKAVTIDGSTDAEKLDSVEETINKPMDEGGSSKYSVDENGNLVDENGDIITDETTVVKSYEADGTPVYYDADEIATLKQGLDIDGTFAKDASEIVEAAGEAADDSVKIADEVLDSVGDAAKKGAASVSSAVSLTGNIGDACTAYKTIEAVGYAAKTVRALQLAKYAMIFLNVADQIKAGVAKPSDVEYLGKILTTEYKATKKAATDSFGYKYKAYGETSGMSDTATMFLAGGGLTGELIGVTTKINDILLGSPQTTCKVVNNPFVSGASLVAGVALLFVPGVGEAISFANIAKGVVSGLALSAVSMLLPALLQDIIAGVVVDGNTVGEPAGDGMASGVSVVMSAIAAVGGNSPLTPTEAVTYNILAQDTAAQYAEEDRLAYSPFDISNSNTFMGGIFYNLLPYLSNASSIAGMISSLVSMPAKSIASISNNNAYALSADDYSMCEDYDYRSLNLATDPYCNVIYGMPTEYLDDDPLEVINYLVDNDDIDPNTGEIVKDSAYDKFKDNCINRTQPLGYTGDDFQTDSGAGCFINSENKNYYLYYIDHRIQKGMDGEDSVLAAAEESGLYGTISFYDGSTNTDTPTTEVANISSTIDSMVSSSIKTVSVQNETPSSTEILSKTASVMSLNSIDNLLSNCGVKCDYSHLEFVKNQEYSL